MSDSASSQPSADAGPPAHVALQDPLPDPSFRWRRILTVSLSAAILLLVWVKIDAVSDVARGADPEAARLAIAGLVQLLRLCLILMGLVQLYYFVAPSAAELTKLVQQAHLIREGVVIKSKASASSPEGGSASSEMIAGKPDAQSAAPPPPSIPEPELDAAPTSGGVPKP